VSVPFKLTPAMVIVAPGATGFGVIEEIVGLPVSSPSELEVPPQPDMLRIAKPRERARNDLVRTSWILTQVEHISHNDS